MPNALLVDSDLYGKNHLSTSEFDGTWPLFTHDASVICIRAGTD